MSDECHSLSQTLIREPGAEFTAVFIYFPACLSVVFLCAVQSVCASKTSDNTGMPDRGQKGCLPFLCEFQNASVLSDRIIFFEMPLENNKIDSEQILIIFQRFVKDFLGEHPNKGHAHTAPSDNRITYSTDATFTLRSMRVLRRGTCL